MSTPSGASRDPGSEDASAEGLTSGAPAIRWPLRTAATLLLAEGAVLVVYVGWVAISAVRQPPDSPALAFATLALLLAGAAGLAFAGWRVGRGSGRLRAPAILGQLLIGIIGYDYVSRGMSEGLVGFAVAAVTIVLLVVPSSTAVLADRRTDSDESSAP